MNTKCMNILNLCIFWSPSLHLNLKIWICFSKALMNWLLLLLVLIKTPPHSESSTHRADEIGPYWLVFLQTIFGMIMVLLLSLSGIAQSNLQLLHDSAIGGIPNPHLKKTQTKSSPLPPFLLVLSFSTNGCAGNSQYILHFMLFLRDCKAGAK